MNAPTPVGALTSRRSAPGRAHRICVFCGSSNGNNEAFAAAARELGAALVEHGYGIVYGGGSVGLMGIVASAALAANGDVIGVIPEALEAKELAHDGVSNLVVTASMHERKAIMAELSDGFVALPGGFGTFEELCEIITWAQLGLHDKPIVVFDVEGFYEPLFALRDAGVAQGFIKERHRSLARRATTIGDVLALLRESRPTPQPKWVSEDVIEGLEA